MTMSVAALGSLALELGEAPIWDAQRSELIVVNIFGREIHRLARSATGWTVSESISTESDVGAAIPLSDGSLVSVEAQGFVHISGGQKNRLFAIPGVTSSSFRANDAKIGPDGRIYVGVLDYDLTVGAGSLWAVNRLGESELLLEGLTIPNGMDWWQDTFWFVNGPEPKIQAYRTTDHGLVPTRHIVTDAIPDGLTIDSEGNIWVALWGQGRVDCFSQEGELLQQVAVPARQPTSVALCGPNLTTLAITTARYQLDEDQLAQTPQAGDVFFTEVPTKGVEFYNRWLG
jgi:sugar lactone lactonase YvrE